MYQGRATTLARIIPARSNTIEADNFTCGQRRLRIRRGTQDRWKESELPLDRKDPKIAAVAIDSGDETIRQGQSRTYAWMGRSAADMIQLSDRDRRSWSIRSVDCSPRPSPPHQTPMRRCAPESGWRYEPRREPTANAWARVIASSQEPARKASRRSNGAADLDDLCDTMATSGAPTARGPPTIPG